MTKRKFAPRYWGLILASAIGGIFMLAVTYTLGFGYPDIVHLRNFGKPEHHKLAAMKLDPSWLITGSPSFRVNTFAVLKDASSASGVWECNGPATFLWQYGVDETIYILEGAAQIDYLGQTITLRPGDSLRFAAGTKAVWTVRRYVKKTYRLDNPGRLVRVLRRIFASST